MRSQHTILGVSRWLKTPATSMIKRRGDGGRGGGEAVPTNKNHVPVLRMDTFSVKNLIFHINNVFKNAFYEWKKSACGARTGQKTNKNNKKVIFTPNNYFMKKNKKSLRRAHWPKNK